MPLPIQNLTVTAAISGIPNQVYGLFSGQKVPAKFENGSIHVTIESLELFETVVIDLKEGELADAAE